MQRPVDFQRYLSSYFGDFALQGVVLRESAVYGVEVPTLPED